MEKKKKNMEADRESSPGDPEGGIMGNRAEGTEAKMTEREGGNTMGSRTVGAMEGGRQTRIGRSAGQMLFWMTVGGVAGFAGGHVMMVMRGNLKAAAELVSSTVTGNLWLFQTLVFAVVILLSLSCYFKAAGLIRQGMEEALDRADDWQMGALMANEIGIILQFFLFGLGAEKMESRFLLNTALFFLCCIVQFVVTALIVKQIQKINPMKKGELYSWNFDKEWLASCDEAERMLIYRSSYRTFQVMKNLMPIMEGVVMFGKFFLGTGNFPIVLVSLIWLVQTGAYYYYSGRFGKKGVAEQRPHKSLVK